jgi:DNA polymerase III subunit epsilon
VDIDPLARHAEPHAACQTLDDWLQHFGIHNAARHEAAADVLATAELLLRLWPQLQRQGISSVKAMQAVHSQERWLQAR